MLALAVTLVTWASAFAAIRHAVHGFPPGSLALIRFAIASFTLAALMLPTRRVVLRALPRGDRIGFLVMGFVGIVVYHVALNAGQRTVEAGTGSLLINIGPIWTALIATAFLGERLGWRGWAGTALAFAGAAILSIGAAGGVRFEGDVGLVLLASVAQAVYFVISKRYLARYRPIEATCFMMWLGTLFLLPFAPELLRALRTASPAEVASAIYLGVVPGALGYITWTYVLSRLPASRASSFLYLVPPLAYLIAWITLHEKPGIEALLGGVPILAGLALVNARVKEKDPPSARRAALPPEGAPVP